MLIPGLIYFAIALLIHELGHLIAARVCAVPVTELGLGWGRNLFSFRFDGVLYKIQLLPIGAFVRLDINNLQTKSLDKQVFVLLAGVLVNLLAAALTPGTMFASINLLLAATNLLPLYQQDGWKCGLVLLRALLQRKSDLVEWSFTIAGGTLSVALFLMSFFRHS